MFAKRKIEVEHRGARTTRAVEKKGGKENLNTLFNLFFFPSLALSRKKKHNYKKHRQEDFEAALESHRSLWLVRKEKKRCVFFPFISFFHSQPFFLSISKKKILKKKQAEFERKKKDFEREFAQKKAALTSELEVKLGQRRAAKNMIVTLVFILRLLA